MNEVKAIADEVMARDPHTTSVSEYTELIRPLFVGLMSQCPTIPAGTKLFRTRHVNARPQKINDVIFPPEHLIQRMGRLNLAGQQIGYLSSARQIAYSEIRPIVGGHIALTRWRTLAPLTFIHIGFTPGVSKTLGSSRTGTEYDWAIKTASFSERNQEIYTFLSECFVGKIGPDEEHRYKITNAIKALLSLDGPIDGIMYPSIAMSANGDNLAIFKKSLHQIKIYSLEYNRVENVEGDRTDIKFIDASTTWNDDGIISWKGTWLNWPPVLPGHEVHFQGKNGEWICFDAQGNEIDPV